MVYNSLDVIKATRILQKICKNSECGKDCLIVKMTGIQPYVDCDFILNSQNNNGMLKNYVKEHKSSESKD